MHILPSNDIICLKALSILGCSSDCLSEKQNRVSDSDKLGAGEEAGVGE